MLVPPSSKSKLPDGLATASACSSSLSPRLVRAGRLAAYLAPLLVLALYAHSIWGSPAFGELADQGYHLEFGRAFADAWRAAELPPKWSAMANGGRGSPAFELYPPLFACLTAGWMHVAGQNAEALRYACITMLLFNLLSVYWAARSWLSPRRSLLAAALALALPGVTFVALGRGMFPNFLAVGWAALAAGAAKRRSAGLLALAGSGLILTHTPTAFLVGLVASSLRPGRRQVVAALAALAVTSWFWIPMLETSRHAQAAYLAEAHPYAESLWFESAPTDTAFRQDWSFLNQTAGYIGLAQLALAAVLFSITRSRHLAILAGWAAFASLWPTGVWLTAVPFYENLQFCWRWQPLLSVAVAIAFASLPLRKALRLAPLLAIVLGLFLPLAAPSERPPSREPSLASNLIEMRPLGAGHELYPPGAPGQTKTVTGDCRAIPVEIQPSRRLYHVTAATDCRLRVRTYHFPGWAATVDEAPVAVQSETETTLQLVDVPAGLHVLELRYKR